MCSFTFLLFIARSGSRVLQTLTPEERALSVNTLADLLITKQSQVLEANAKDLEEATKSGLGKCSSPSHKMFAVHTRVKIFRLTSQLAKFRQK